MCARTSRSPRARPRAARRCGRSRACSACSRLAPQLIAEVGRAIARLKAEGQSILLVEQNIKLTLALADDVVIINTGKVVFQGSAAETEAAKDVVTQHLGVF